jgi:hypothetical protein
MRPFPLALLLGLALAAPALADVADGMAAYDAGDYRTAFAELRAPAQAGEPAAQHVLARMYFAGQGVARDVAQGVAWQRKAAEAGEPRAQLDLAMRYQYGSGVAADPAEAERWYRLAAEQGLPTAQYRLGLLILERGGDAAAERVEAHLWLNLAGAKLAPGDARADVVAARDALAARMSADEIREAQLRARDWRPKGWAALTAKPPQ